jgi:pilus assembly protein CpaE
MNSYPVVIADLSGATPIVKKTILTRAHEIIVVSTPTLASLRSARSLMVEIKKLHGGIGDNMDLVINMSGMAPGKEVSKRDIKNALECEPQAVIPYDSKLFIGSENEGRKISTEKSGQDIIQKLLPMIQKIVARDNSVVLENTDNSLLGGLLGKMKKK